MWLPVTVKTWIQWHRYPRFLIRHICIYTHTHIWNSRFFKAWSLQFFSDWQHQEIYTFALWTVKCFFRPLAPTAALQKQRLQFMLFCTGFLCQTAPKVWPLDFPRQLLIFQPLKGILSSLSPQNRKTIHSIVSTIASLLSFSTREVRKVLPSN